jgi:nucleotide-binding universal stress UspA family protein
MDSGIFSPKHILVPTDFSSYAHNALRQAMEIASTYHAAVILLHVIDEHVTQCVIDFCLSDTVINQIKQQQTSTTTDKLQREINGVIESHRDVDISGDIKTGIPYDEILKEQQDRGIDLIVMASHGRTGIVKNLIGSVAEKVLRGARCPVMLIRN